MKDEILDLLNEINPDADFENSEDFIDEALIDSYGMIELVEALEDKYEIEIDGMDIIPENFKSLETICELVNKSM